MNIFLILFLALVAYLYIGYFLAHFLFKRYLNVYARYEPGEYFSWISFWFPTGIPSEFDDCYSRGHGTGRINQNTYYQYVSLFWPIRLLMTILTRIFITIYWIGWGVLWVILFPLKKILK